MMAEHGIDTSRTLEIEAAPWKLALFALGGATFVGLGYWMSQATAGTGRQSIEWIHFWGWVSMAFFGPVTLLLLWRLLTERGTVITFSPAGLSDIRVLPDTIPWTAVASIRTWQYSGNEIMIVGLHPGEEDKLHLSRIARWTRGANARLGADGLAINAQGTRISHDRLIQTAIAYAEAHGR